MRLGGREVGGFGPWAAVSGSLAVAAVLVAGALGGGSTADAGTAAARPNIVVIQTDDQTVEQMRVMENTRRLLGKRGATFRNEYTNWPLCCPSRATLLTGQYAHNHGVLGNSPPEGGYGAFDNSNTTAVWLQSGGYVTAHVGKFLNGYGAGDGAAEVPPGWDEWYAGTAGTTQRVYDYTENENGTLVDYGSEVEDFKQDVYTQRAVDLIGQYFGAGAPVYLELDYTAPHSGGPEPLPQPPDNCGNTARPAARHANAFNHEPIPQDPSFNEADVTDKPQEIQDLPLLDSGMVADLTRRYRCRIESLLSVDEGVAAVVGALRAQGALGNTYVIFTSDNGYFTGEHRIRSRKNRVYEPSSTVPLLMRGPGIPHGARVRDLTVNADIAATVVDLSGVEPTLTVDGRSLLPAAHHPWVERGRELLIETNLYSAIHTQRYVWVEYATGEFELYDLRADPFQLRSRHADPAYAGVRERLADRLAALRSCAGADCRALPALDLDLEFAHGRGGCAQPPVIARIIGDDLLQVESAEFHVGGRRLATDSQAPFRFRYRRRVLDPGPTLIRARAALIDGRRVAWERRLRICRAR